MKKIFLKVAIILIATKIHSSESTKITIHKNHQARLSIMIGKFLSRLVAKDVFSIKSKKSDEKENFYEIANYLSKIKKDLELQDSPSLKIIYAITEFDAERQALCTYLKIKHP